MMRRTIYSCFLIGSLAISCNPPDRNHHQLGLEYNRDNLLDVTHTATGSILIRSLNASYADQDGRIRYFLDGKERRTTRSFSDEMGSGTEIVFENDYEDDSLQIKWILRTFEDKPALVGRLEMKNNSSDKKRINRLVPFSTGEIHSDQGQNQDQGGILMDTDDTLRYLEIQPETWAYKYQRKLNSSGTGKFVTGIATPKGNGVVIGCISFDRFRGTFVFKDRRKNSGLLNFRTYNDIDEHLMLGPGQILTSEWIYIDCVNDVFTGLEKWAQLAGMINKAVVSDPPATGFYTWYYYRDYVSEEIMIDNMRLLAENRDRFPVNYVHIDWGWQRQYSSGDTTTNDKFPHGLGWLARQIKEHNFSPSIWVNPFMYTNPTAEAPDKHPDIFLKKANGQMVEHEPIRNIMARVWGDAEYMISDGVINVLDVSNPDTYDFLEKRYEWVRSLGFDMAMMDFIIYGRNNYEAGDRLKNPGLSTYEGIRKALFAARKGLGPGGNVLGCGTIYETAVGTSNLTRISLDATANWPSVKMASKDLILQYFMNNKLWTNYADGIFVRDTPSPYWGEFEKDEEGNLVPMFVTDDEAQFYTAVTGLTQAAVMYTEDLQRLKPERQWLLSMVLPIYQNGKFRPLDLFSSIPSKTLQLKCLEGNREWIVAAGLNWSDEVDEQGLDLRLLNLEEGKQYHAFNVFDQQYIGLISKSDRLGPISAHGVLLANLVEDLNRPQIVGNDLHISQGGVEFGNENWEEGTKELAIELKDLHGRKGNIYVFLPEAYAYAGDDAGGEPVVSGTLLKVPVMLDAEKTVRLTFE